MDVNATRGTEEGMFMTDCVECRPGMFSPVFADLIGAMKYNIQFFGMPAKELDDLDLVTVTLISSERTFSVSESKQAYTIRALPHSHSLNLSIYHSLAVSLSLLCLYLVCAFIQKKNNEICL